MQRKKQREHRGFIVAILPIIMGNTNTFFTNRLMKKENYDVMKRYLVFS